MFRFPSVICTRCTGFFCLAIIKGPPNDIYCIIEEPSKHYFTEKVSYSQIDRPFFYNYECFKNRGVRIFLLPLHTFHSFSWFKNSATLYRGRSLLSMYVFSTY